MLGGAKSIGADPPVRDKSLMLGRSDRLSRTLGTAGRRGGGEFCAGLQALDPVSVRASPGRSPVTRCRREMRRRHDEAATRPDFGVSRVPAQHSNAVRQASEPQEVSGNVETCQQDPRP
jgi:hypothetical protein